MNPRTVDVVAVDTPSSTAVHVNPSVDDPITVVGDRRTPRVGRGGPVQRT